jgi:amino acid adenylation domain-containing protein
MRHLLTDAQMGIWVAQQLRPEAGALFNNPAALRLRGSLDVSRLRRAVDRLVARHELLRVGFAEGERGPEQIEDRHWPRLRLEPWPAGVDGLRPELNRRVAQPLSLHGSSPGADFTLLQLAAADHVLLVNLHHIVADGWSKAVLLDELLTLLRDETEGRETELPPAGRFFDHAATQRAYRGTSRYGADLAYWTSLLEPPLPALELPSDWPRQAASLRRGGLLELTLDPQQAAQLKARARELNTSLFSVLLAGFFVLVYRNTEQRDLVVGVPFACRSGGDFERTVGPFVNALPIRLQIDAEASFSHLAGQVKRAVLETFRHQRVPFEEIVRAVAPPGGNGFPIFKVMFQLDNLPMPELALEGLELRPIALDTGLAQMDLSISMQDTGEGLAAQMGFDAELFDPASARRLADQFEVVLAAAAADPEIAVGRMPILSAGEQEALVRWNATTVALPEVPGVYGLIARQLAGLPAAVAVEYGGEATTYGELSSAAAALAGLLREAGVGAGDRVAILAAGPLQVAAQLAVWSRAASSIALDPEAPVLRNQAVLADAEPRVLLGSPALLDLHTGGPWSSVPAPDWSFLRQSGGRVAPEPEGLTAEGDAVIVYTSGTTGRPKGVRLTQRNLLNLAVSFIDCYGVTSADAVLPVTATTAATFLGECFPTLAAGARLVLADSREMLDPSALCDLIASRRVTILSTVPSVAARLDGLARNFGGLRLLICGGEVLEPRQVRALRAVVQVVNSYGLTEGGVCSTYHRLAASDDRSRRRIPVGRPIANTRIYVLSDQGMVQPLGVPGELCLAGDGLVAGYVDERLDTARFISTGELEPRLLKTGDLARWLPHGELEFVGRRDRQLQIRGHRVEPAEIERCLMELPEITQVHVALRPDGRGESLPVAFLSLVKGAALAPDLLRAHLAERLPLHMRPAALVRMDALPVDGDGRIDDRGLPPVPPERFGAGDLMVPPETENERELARIWCDLLGRPEVSVTANFFDVGGHSLLLAPLQVRIRTTFGREIALVEFFRLTNIRNLARHLDGGIPVERDTVTGEAQRRVERRRAALADGRWRGRDCLP